MLFCSNEDYCLGGEQSRKNNRHTNKLNFSISHMCGCNMMLRVVYDATSTELNFEILVGTVFLFSSDVLSVM